MEYMKLNTDKLFYSSECYFSSQVVKPTWDILIKIYPEINCYYEILNQNITKWKELLDSHK